MVLYNSVGFGEELFSPLFFLLLLQANVINNNKKKGIGDLQIFIHIY